MSREQAARNRERIVETAAQLFRERGFASAFTLMRSLAALAHLQRVEGLHFEPVAQGAPS